MARAWRVAGGGNRLPQIDYPVYVLMQKLTHALGSVERPVNA